MLTVSLVNKQKKKERLIQPCCSGCLISYRSVSAIFVDFVIELDVVSHSRCLDVLVLAVQTATQCLKSGETSASLHTIEQ